MRERGQNGGGFGWRALAREQPVDGGQPLHAEIELSRDAQFSGIAKGDS
jgi:hypothetical protein